jgi:hypothetical protein
MVMKSNHLLLSIIPCNTLVLTIQLGPATLQLQLLTPCQVVHFSPRIPGSRTKPCSHYIIIAHPVSSRCPVVPGCTTTIDPQVKSLTPAPEHLVEGSSQTHSTVHNGDYLVHV